MKKPLINLNDKQIEELKKSIKEIKWYRQAVVTKLPYAGTPMLSVMEKVSYPFLHTREPKEHEGYMSLEGMRAIVKEHIDSAMKSIDVIDEKYHKFESVYNNMKKILKKAESVDIENLKIEKLMGFFIDMDDANYDFWQDSFFVDHFDAEGEIFLKKELKKHNLNIIHEHLSKLMRPQKINFVELSNLELCKVALNVKNKDFTEKELLEMLLVMAKNHYFVQNSWGNVNILQEKDFLEPLNEIISEDKDRIREMIKEYENLENNTKKEYEELLNKYSLPKEIINLLHMFRTLATWRDERKEIVLRSNHFYELISRRFSKEFDTDIKIIYNAFPFELRKVRTKKDLDDLNIDFNNRNTGLIVGHIKDNESNLLMSGKEAKEVMSLLNSNFLDEYEEIKGVVASKGDTGKKFIRGKVNIILGETHFTKFNEGDVLVTPMTRPEFLPLMKKAKAIITDEGGLTCHAAIVSRELGVPCIIGTQVASKKLFDNREVEMNMETGIIKLVE